MAACSALSPRRCWHHALSHEAPLQTAAWSLTLLHLMPPVQHDRVIVSVTVHAATESMLQQKVSLHNPLLPFLSV